MDDWCEGGVVVGGDVLRDTTRLLRLSVALGVDAADVPEDRRDAPLGAEGSEVLARGDGRGELMDAVVAELRAERGGDARRPFRIVGRERVVLGRLDLRRARRARGG